MKLVQRCEPCSE